MAQATLAQLSGNAAAAQKPAPKENEDISMPAIPIGMETIPGFVGMQRVANLFASSSLVPDGFRGNIANCFIALDMSQRIGVSPMQVMQNLHIIKGKPSWSTAFLVGMLNMTRRFSALRYEWRGEEGKDDRACRAFCTELATGENLYGAWVSIRMAMEEGWYYRKDKYGKDVLTKWQTMPELMLSYRAAAFFVRTYAPEVMLGLYSQEEQEDISAQETGSGRPASARKRADKSAEETVPGHLDVFTEKTAPGLLEEVGSLKETEPAERVEETGGMEWTTGN